jgi:hypothetical protein
VINHLSLLKKILIILLRLFDKKENERLSVIKEEAFTQRKVKTDAPQQKISEKKKSEPINPYLQELKRTHK